jgi:hypothetical protein
MMELGALNCNLAGWFPEIGSPYSKRAFPVLRYPTRNQAFLAREIALCVSLFPQRLARFAGGCSRRRGTLLIAQPTQNIRSGPSLSCTTMIR